jgi:hypothetical protein
VTTDKAGAKVGLTIMLNPAVKYQQKGLGLNNFYGVKVSLRQGPML